MLYAFTTEDRTYQFPPPGLTLHWFEVAFARDDIWAAMRLSLGVAAVRHAARARPRHARRVRAGAARNSAARKRSRCCSCCRSRCPASSPASRCWPAIKLARLEPGFWTIVAGHATFCLVIVYNNVDRAPAPPAARAGSRRRWTSAPTARRPSATCCCRRSRPRCSPAACWRSRCRSTRSSSRSSPPATSARCRSGSSTSCSGRASGRSRTWSRSS